MKKLGLLFGLVIVVTLVLFGSGVASAAVKTHTFYWGPAFNPWVKIVQRVYTGPDATAKGFSGQMLFEYEVTNLGYNPPGGNGLSGFRIWNRYNVPFANQFGPGGWIVQGYVSAWEWDAVPPTAGIPVGGVASFGFTVPDIPQFGDTIYPNDGTNWMHTWDTGTGRQRNLFFGEISGPKMRKVVGPSSVVSRPEDHPMCTHFCSSQHPSCDIDGAGPLGDCTSKDATGALVCTPAHCAAHDPRCKCSQPGGGVCKCSQDHKQEADEQSLFRDIPINVDVVHSLWINTYRKPWWPWDPIGVILDEVLPERGITPQTVALAALLEARGMAAGLPKAHYEEVALSLPHLGGEQAEVQIPTEIRSMELVGISPDHATGSPFEATSFFDVFAAIDPGFDPFTNTTRKCSGGCGFCPAFWGGHDCNGNDVRCGRITCRFGVPGQGETAIVPMQQVSLADELDIGMPQAIEELQNAVGLYVNEINTRIAAGEPANLPQLLPADVVQSLSAPARAILFQMQHKCLNRQKDKLDLGNVGPSLRPGMDGFDLEVKSNDEWIEEITWSDLRGLQGDDAEGWIVPADRIIVLKDKKIIKRPWKSSKYQIHYSQQNIRVIFKPHWSIHAGKYQGKMTIRVTQI